MKFKLVSDLHLEFYRQTIRTGLVKQQPEWIPTPTDEDKETTLLLAGDIDVGTKGKNWIIDRCKQYQFVVYILGNHEFYGQDFDTTIYTWDNMEMPENFTFLDNDVIHFGSEVRVIGGTLWTLVTDPFDIWNGRRAMSDYNVIRKNGDKLTVNATNNAHQLTVQFIEAQLQRPWYGKTIVMTHHLPHPLCVAERFKGNNLNAFFMTDLDHIMENFDIDVWCHGHTHDNVDVEVHGTRILCNPMGYHGIQLNQDFNEGLVFEC